MAIIKWKMENDDLEFFGPRAADQQIPEPHIIPGSLRIFFAKHASGKFMFAGAYPAGDDANAELWGAVVTVNTGERRGSGLAVNQAFDDSAIWARAIRKADDRAFEVVFDLRARLVAHKQSGRQRAVVVRFGAPARPVLFSRSPLGLDFADGFEFAVIHLVADQWRRKVAQDRRGRELFLLGQERDDEIGVEFMPGVRRGQAVFPSTGGGRNRGPAARRRSRSPLDQPRRAVLRRS